ncbi:MAG: GNAT family N-acetyltransferase, partial [Adlercreutzia sp.]|nr:GNAT family N-acetyltransferase [Adlercreutzia sp.]
PYATVHRCAVDPVCRGRGIIGKLFAFACEKAATDGKVSVRIDTHADNAPMRRAVEKFGFIPCGDITLTEGPEAGAPRIAFEKVLE